MSLDTEEPVKPGDKVLWFRWTRNKKAPEVVPVQVVKRCKHRYEVIYQIAGLPFPTRTFIAPQNLRYE